MSLLAVDNLTLSIDGQPILDGVTLRVEPGSVLGVIGGSGAGKSMTALSVMRLLPPRARLTGSITLDGTDLLAKAEREMNAIRGRTIGMVFQEPMTALDPLKTIGAQVAETILVHRGASRRDAAVEADRALERAGLPADLVPRDRYPHELSGGQRQRVVIASAIALKPRLLIADEPTTALDVTTQSHILTLLRRLVDDDGMGLLFITHDLAVAASLADDLAVMRAGRVVESGSTQSILVAPQHAYTRELLAAATYVPQRVRRVDGGGTILAVDGAVRDYRLPPPRPFAKPGLLRAVDAVSFTIARGESVGLVGESGSGKSTLARAVLGLDPLQAGSIRVDGSPVVAGKPATRHRLQVVFQDPYSSFDPRQRVATLVAEPFHLLGAAAPLGPEREKRVVIALEHVGLAAADADKYIHEFSGGERQRVAIARALVIEPDLIVLDEAVSALDVVIRGQILDLLADLGARLGLAFLFISHDLSVVRAVTDRVLVMRAGKIVESGVTSEVFANPQHPYTRELIAAVPNLERTLASRAHQVGSRFPE